MRLHPPHFDVTMSPHMLRKLWTYACAAEGEISAIGEISIDGPLITVTDNIHLLKQDGTGGSTRLDMGAFAELCADYQATGKDPGSLRFWIHTHPHMSAFFSGIDDSTIEKLATMMDHPIVAACFNTDGDTMWRIVDGDAQVDLTYKIPGKYPTRQEMDVVLPEIKGKVAHNEFFGGRFKYGWRGGKYKTYGSKVQGGWNF